MPLFTFKKKSAEKKPKAEKQDKAGKLSKASSDVVVVETSSDVYDLSKAHSTNALSLYSESNAGQPGASPEVPPLPGTLGDPGSAVSTVRIAQPHTSPSLTARAPNAVPSNPQLTPQLTGNSSVTTSARNPQDHGAGAANHDAANHVAEELNSSTSLHRADTLPPSYNSLGIHQASAPSPDLVNSTQQNPIDHNAYQSAPLPPTPSQLPLSQQTFQQPYPTPTPNNPWPTQQAHPSASPSGSHQYVHRPYVPPVNENQTYPIIMAIDWGTTFSSMAYAFQQDGEVHEVSTW